MRKVALSILLIAVIAVATFYLIRPKHPEYPPEEPTIAATPVVEPTIVPEPEPQPAEQEPVVEPEKKPSPAEPDAEEGASISGRVTDSKGNPIQGAQVNAEFDPLSGLAGFGTSQGGPPATYKPIRGTISDAKGDYKLTGATPSRGYVVFVKARGYARASTQIAVPMTGEAKNVDFMLENGAIISGHVVDTNRNRVAKASVEAQLRDDPERTSGAFMLTGSRLTGFYSFRAETNEEGEFALVDLSPGSYAFCVGLRSGNGGSSQMAQNQPVTVKPGDVIRDLELVLNAGDRGNIEGYARDDEGNGIADVFIKAWFKSEMRNARTDASGHYRLEGLSEDSLNLEFDRQGYTEAELHSVPARTMNADVVMLPLGGISGIVMDAATRAPVSGPEVQIVRLLPRRIGESAPMPSRLGSCPGSKVGEFILEGVTPAKVTLEASAPRYVPQQVPDIVVEPRKVTTGVTVYLSRGGAIEGYVTRNGVPMTTGANVKAFPLSRLDNVRRRPVNESGYYRFEGLAPDTWTVTATAEAEHRGAIGSASVQVPTAGIVRLDFELGGSATITGRVSWPQGYTVPVVLVRSATATEPVSLSNLGVLESQCAGYSLCGDGGIYVISDLPPGSYNVTAFCGLSGGEETDLLQKSRTVTLRDGQTLELDFAL